MPRNKNKRGTSGAIEKFGEGCKRFIYRNKEKFSNSSRKGQENLSVPSQRLKNEEGGSGGDNWSTQSNASDDSSWRESDSSVKGDDDAEEVSEQENFEDKFIEFLDGTLNKSAKTRIEALEGVQKCLQRRYVADFLMDRKETVADHLVKCLRKGKGQEIGLAASCVSLAIIQLGQEAEAIFSATHPILMTLLADNSTDSRARGMCAMSLAMSSILCCDDIEVIKSLTNTLEDIFSLGYGKGENSPSVAPELSQLMSQALSAWCLMLTMAPVFQVYQHIDNHLDSFPDLLQSSDLDLRIGAGEAVALLYELARDQDEDFERDMHDELVELLKQLATDSVKHRAKKDRRQQRSCFRDIKNYVAENESPSELIRITKDSSLQLCTWSQKKIYDSFCQILMTGTSVHLKSNPLFRDMLDLGPPALETQGAQAKGMTKAQRTAIHATAFKLRTKARAKHRDKRSVAVNGF